MVVCCAGVSPGTGGRGGTDGFSGAGGGVFGTLEEVLVFNREVSVGFKVIFGRGASGGIISVSLKIAIRNTI